MEPPPHPNPEDLHPEDPRPASPEVLLYWDFCNTSVQASSSPRRDHVPAPSDQRNTTTSSVSTKGETILVKKSILRRLDNLKEITDQPVNEDTVLKKLKSLQTETGPRVEKAILEL